MTNDKIRLHAAENIFLSAGENENYREPSKEAACDKLFFFPFCTT